MPEDSRKKAPWAIRCGLPLAGSLILAISAFLVLPPELRSSGSWRGWSMILVRPGRSVSEALEILDRSRVSPVWSEITQTVYLSDFVDSSRVSLAQALARVIPGDPRRTPWLDGLSGFYRAGEGDDTWSILYLPSSSSRRAVRSLARSLPREAWRSTDSILVARPGLLWVPGAALAVFLAIRSRRDRIRTLVAALPWIPLGLSGRIAAALAGIWGYQGLLEWSSREGTHPAQSRASGPAVRLASWIPPALTLAFLAAADLSSIPGMVLSLASSACLILGLERLSEWKASRRVHDIFVGLILDADRERREMETRRRNRVLAALAVSAAAFLARAVLPASAAGSSPTNPALPLLPGPGPSISARFPDARTLEGIVLGRSGRSLPTLADAVAHRAYQQSLPYSRIGARKYGSLASAVQDTFDPQGEQVVRVQETVAEFDDAWVRKAFQEEAGTGIGAVLADQRGIVEPRIGAAEGGLRTGSLALRDVFFYIILLAPAVLGTLWNGMRLPILTGRGSRTDSRR